MKTYSFDEKYPYTAIVCAESEEQAQAVYYEEVCELASGEAWCETLPEEIDRETTLALMSSSGDDGKTAEEYLDEAIAAGEACMIAVDASLL